MKDPLRFRKAVRVSIHTLVIGRDGLRYGKSDRIHDQAPIAVRSGD
jgi:hypothetical protein